MSELVERLRAVKIRRPIPRTIFHVEEDHPLCMEAAAEITRLQKELETAREDALEEAAAIFDARNDKITELMEREYHQVVKDSCVSAILRNATDAAAIRALKDKEVAG